MREDGHIKGCFCFCWDTRDIATNCTSCALVKEGSVKSSVIEKTDGRMVMVMAMVVVVAVLIIHS